MLVIFSIFNSTYFFELFIDDSHVDGIIWMCFALCPNQFLCKKTFENQFQYCSYQIYTWKRHLFKQKNTVHSKTTNVGYFFYLHFYLFIWVVYWWFTLMELFGCVLHCVQTSFYVKRHLKNSSSTARTKSRLEKDTYSRRKVQFILVPQIMVIFFIFIFTYSFELFNDDSRW